MRKIKFSAKGKELISLYADMASHGYDRQDGIRVTEAFSDFELRPYRQQLLEVMQQFEVKTVLDYGCGGADWLAPDFHENGTSAKEYFNLTDAYRYEPARNIDERRRVDCVISFDVLEHVFVSDVPNVLRNIFQCANKLVALNVACYPAAAKLPNGENAHITVRPPHWWKGMIDAVATEFPNVSIYLICSTGWRKSSAWDVWSANDWNESSTFVTNS